MKGLYINFSGNSGKNTYIPCIARISRFPSRFFTRERFPKSRESMKSSNSPKQRKPHYEFGKTGKFSRDFERVGKRQSLATSGFEATFPEFPEFLKQEGAIIFLFGVGSFLDIPHAGKKSRDLSPITDARQGG